MNISRLFFAVAMGVGCVSSPAFAQANDILGVAVGMTSKEVTEALQKANPKFMLETEYYAGPDGKPANVASVRACATNMPELDKRCNQSHVDISRDYIVVTFGAVNGRAFHVARRWEPGKMDRPQLTTFNDALQKKYGKLNREREGAGFVSYANYPNSQGKQDRRCRPFNPIGQAPNQANPECSLSIFMDTSFDTSLNILNGMNMAIFDHRVLVADIREGNAIAAGQKQKEGASKAEAARKAAAPKL